MYDPHTRESRGFGFVTMETPEEADAAITALNGTELFGKVVNVEKVCRCYWCAQFSSLLPNMSIGTKRACQDADSWEVSWTA